MDEGHRAEARCAPGAWTALTLALLHHLQEQARAVPWRAASRCRK